MFPNSVFRRDPFFTEDANLSGEMGRIDNYMKEYWHPFDGTPRCPMMPPYVPPVNNHNDRMVRYNYELDSMPLGRPYSHGEMFHKMRDMFDEAHRSSTVAPKVHSYRSSKVMSYTSNGVDEPKKYEAFSETSQSPGGVKQTFKRERNSVTGKERMQAGRFINDRGHVVEKTEDIGYDRPNRVHVNHDYVNMDQGEEAEFHDDWDRLGTGKWVVTKQEGWVQPRRLLKWQHPFSRNYDGTEFDNKRRVSFKYDVNPSSK